MMKKTRKYRLLATILAAFVIMSSLGGCGKSSNVNYQKYVQALLDANYHGKTDEYISITGAKKTDATALLEGNSKYLAENLINYYGFDVGVTSEIAVRLVESAKLIYRSTKYEVSKAYEKNGKYYVDVTIYPENFLETTHDEVKAFIDEKNEEIAAGKYNDTVMNDYEKLFIDGICDILDKASSDMSYREAETVTVTIIQTDSSYSISKDDMLLLENALIYSE